MIRRLLARTWLLSAFALLWVIVSVLASWRLCNWEWFGRAGSILTLAGASLAGRAMIRAGRRGLEPRSPMRIGRVMGSEYSKDGKLMMQVQRSPESVEEDREARHDANATVVGFAFAILGTIIWGYGDLVGRLVCPAGR
jgi:hypothetical protein